MKVKNMTQEDKDLLLKDLCARLPYGVKICYIFNGEECVSTIEKIDAFSYIWDNYNGCYHVREIKPYLFPLSSMTEEQWREITDIQIQESLNSIDSDNDCMSNSLFSTGELKTIEWCYVNHIDIHGLIPMGLALDATGLNVY